MAQFRVEFVLDQPSGKYLAEMYHPQRESELLLRTEAVYPSQEAAVLGVVQLFKNAILQVPAPGTPPREVKPARKAGKKAAKKPARKAGKRPPKKAKKAAKAKKARGAKRKQVSKRRR